jgi:hypothetical protein
VTREVSSACCCAPKAQDGCASIERTCTCCQVSFTNSEPATPAAIALATYSSPSGKMGLLSTTAPSLTSDQGVSTRVDARGVSSLHASTPPGFILYHSIRC